MKPLTCTPPPTQRTIRLLAAVLLALSIVFGQLGLLEHEIKYHLSKPDTACATCVMAHHLGHAPVTEPYSLTVTPIHGTVVAVVPAFIIPPAAVPYPARAPPFALRA